MQTLIETHILQNFAPSNLNRDDTGSPKDAIFGGVRRGRISSQCLKRAARTYFRDNALIGDDNLALRTKRVTDALVEALTSHGHPEEAAKRTVVLALGGVGLTVTKDDTGTAKSQYLLFLGAREIGRIADLIHRHWAALQHVPAAEATDKSRRARDAKKDAKSAVPPELVAATKGALDGGKAVDIAMFGRMLADLPEKNKDAAVQVAHAISTHKVDPEFDYFTAVDDRRPDDTKGADMLGTVEFASACYYRYAAIDVEKLVENLQGDRDLALAGIEAFLKAGIYAEPTGKQNTFAAHNPPGFVAFVVREKASPRNLANAFERAIRPGDEGLTAASVEALAREWRKLDEIYGQGGHASYVNASDAEGVEFPGEDAKTVDTLIRRTIEYLRPLVTR